MTKMSEPIVFFGSGPVAAKSLELLYEWVKIEAVVTKPQPSHHREPFPVLVAAEELGLTVYTPNGKAALSELVATKPFKSRVGLVIDYGFIINQDVIDYFALGIINSHFSLLPKLRGADPISFAILNGEAETGVSLMLINARMDEGMLLAQAPYTLPEAITTPKLTETLIDISDHTLRAILPEYIAGRVTPVPQSSAIEPTYSRKLTKDDGIIDWNKPTVQIEREIRAFIEWPKSRTTLAGKDVIITKAHTVPSNAIDSKPGDVEIDKELGLIMVRCKEGYVCLDKLKPAGKGEMTAKAFLAGYRLR